MKGHLDEQATFNRRFRYALVGFVIVDFIIIAFDVYYMNQR